MNIEQDSNQNREVSQEFKPTEKQLARSREASANFKRILALVEFYSQDQQNDIWFNHRMIMGLQEQFRNKCRTGRYARGGE